MTQGGGWTEDAPLRPGPEKQHLEAFGMKWKWIVGYCLGLGSGCSAVGRQMSTVQIGASVPLTPFLAKACQVSQ